MAANVLRAPKYRRVIGNNAAAVAVDGDLTVGGAVTITGAVINSSTVLFKDLTEVVTATNVIAAAESGSVFFLSAAAGFVSTLPAVAAGLHFTFIIQTSPTSVGYTIVGASGTPIVGGTVSSDDAAGAAAITTTGVLTITLVANKAVKGDSVEVWCNGTNWFARGQVSVHDALTFS